MKTEIESKWFSRVCSDLLATANAKKATVYVNEKVVIKATFRHKPGSRSTREEMVVTAGAPNYLEIRFIQSCKKAGEPFPVKRTQFKFYPAKKK